MQIDGNMLEELKKEAMQNFVPILRDNTMKLIEERLELLRPKKILEVGTAVGYSAITFSKYLDEGGKIDTIERNDKRYEKALENISKFNLQNAINVIFGDAKEEMKKLPDSSNYDVIFIDAAKGQYIAFLEEAKRLVKNGGLIIADNVLFRGLVLSDYNEHKNRTAVNRLREFLKIIKEEKCFDSEVIDIDDGVAFITVNK
ncbi:MAG: O-methyltransferase [Clostridia bacterium]|nr:O-methyltransferase [Clostridia bacterium]